MLIKDIRLYEPCHFQAKPSFELKIFFKKMIKTFLLNKLLKEICSPPTLEVLISVQNVRSLVDILAGNCRCSPNTVGQQQIVKHQPKISYLS